MGDGTLEEGYALHTGANESLRTVELPASIVIEEGKEAGLTILVDIKRNLVATPSTTLKPILRYTPYLRCHL